MAAQSAPLSRRPFLQVLGEAADYVPPTAAATGRYSLKRACWKEFDPYYPHYTR